jgi:hypothetical protein
MTKGLYLRFSVVRDNEAYCWNLGQMFWAEDYLWVVPFLHRLVRGLASLRLNPRLVNLRFVVYKVALAWVFLAVLRFNARQWHSINAAYAFIYLLPSAVGSQEWTASGSNWHKHRHTDTNTDTLTHRHTDLWTHTQTHWDRHTDTHTHTHTLTHTQTHWHTDTNTDTLTHRHTDTQTH